MKHLRYVVCLTAVALSVACAGPRTPTSDNPTTSARSESPATGTAEATVPAPATTASPVVPTVHAVAVTPSALRHRDPAIEKLLTTADPARIYDTATPGPDVPMLTSAGPTEQRIRPGETVTLSVRTVPGSVTTFASQDGGVFPNHAASITVLADEQGVAMTTLTADPGTVDDVQVQVGSPGAVGTIGLLVHVLYPQSPLVTSTNPAEIQP